MPKKKKENIAWHPTMINKNAMQFKKILNLDFVEESKSLHYDINILEELETGEILLRIFKKNTTILVGVRLLDKNIGISDLNNEIRHNLRLWISEKTPIWEIKNIGVSDLVYPKSIDGGQIIQTENLNKNIKIKKISTKETLKDTNLVIKKSTDKPKPKRKNSITKIQPTITNNEKNENKPKPRKRRKTVKPKELF